jgi:hypothetical protein
VKLVSAGKAPLESEFERSTSFQFVVASVKLEVASTAFGIFLNVTN